jgi:hypothetical protein
VIVPGDDPGKGRVRQLQIGVAFVEPVAIAVILKRDDLRAIVLTQPPGHWRAFVNVIA